MTDPTYPVKAVMFRPDCGWCRNEPAVVEGIAALGDDGLTAQLCESCWDQIGSGTPTVLVHAAELYRLPTVTLVKRYLREAAWVYARTMPKWPHEYVLIQRSHDPWLHLRVVAWIRARGEERVWRGRWGKPELHSYWRNPEDGREYWTLRPAETILNRERDAGHPEGFPATTEVESGA
jgi:hypothetical protein